MREIICHLHMAGTKDYERSAESNQIYFMPENTEIIIIIISISHKIRCYSSCQHTSVYCVGGLTGELQIMSVECV